MKKQNGFALAITLLFLLILTLFGFSVLLLAGNYYASATNLFEKENARLSCDQAIHSMIDRHNLENTTPRFFQDSQIWNGKTMTPMTWNYHQITASLNAPWNAAGANLLQATSHKGPFGATRSVEVRQRRLEEFALYTDSAQILRDASLFEGPVFARGALMLDAFEVRFRQIVQADIQPPTYASLRKHTLQHFDYPEARTFLGPSFFSDQAASKGITIRARNAAFWKGNRYELNLDLLQVEKQPRNKWRIKYNNIDLGTVATPLLWFDDTLAVNQASTPPIFYSQKPSAPVYLASAADVILLSSLHATEDASYRHPVAIVAEDAMYIDASAPRSLCLEALLIAYGSDPDGAGESGLIVQPGGQPTSEVDLKWIRSKVAGSTLLLEESHREATLQALDAGERFVWFCGGLVLTAPWNEPAEPVLMHFQGATDTYPLLPSLPFVYIVEGSEQWL